MKTKKIFFFLIILVSQLSYGSEEVISYFSRVSGEGFDDDYYKYSNGEWSSYIKMNDDFPILYLENEANNVKISTEAYSDGGQEPNILKIEDALVCDKDSIIVSTSEIIGIESPTFLYHRYIYTQSNDQYNFFTSVLDESSTRAGGLLPSVVSPAINDKSLCLNQ